MTQLDRGMMLADLSDAVNELTEIRNHSELIEAEERDGEKRRRVRRRRVQTFPSLLDELAAAMKPGADGDATAAGFESRPAAELEPINVMALIRDQSAIWASALGVQRKTLKGLLHGLVGANHSDIQLANLVKDAKYWVKRARLATGWDDSPMILNEPCPQCFRRNSLRIARDMDYAVCSRCGVDWPTEYFGLLAQVLEQNRTHTVLTEPALRCEQPNGFDSCYLRIEHDGNHRDSKGRYWGQPDVSTVA